MRICAGSQRHSPLHRHRPHRSPAGASAPLLLRQREASNSNFLRISLSSFLIQTQKTLWQLVYTLASGVRVGGAPGVAVARARGAARGGGADVVACRRALPFCGVARGFACGRCNADAGPGYEAGRTVLLPACPSRRHAHKCTHLAGAKLPQPHLQVGALGTVLQVSANQRLPASPLACGMPRCRQCALVLGWGTVSLRNRRPPPPGFPLSSLSAVAPAPWYYYSRSG